MEKTAKTANLLRDKQTQRRKDIACKGGKQKWLKDMSIGKRSTLGKKKQLGFSDGSRVVTMYTLLLKSTEGAFRKW